MPRGLLEGIEQGKAKGKAEGLAEGMQQGQRAVIQTLYQNGLSAQAISQMVGKPLEEIEALCSKFSDRL